MYLDQVYRDMTKPIGALNAKRLDYFKALSLPISALRRILDEHVRILVFDANFGHVPEG